MKKQTSIYFEDIVLDAVKLRADKEKVKMNDFVVSSVEKNYLYPFFSWRHLRNYFYLTKKLKLPLDDNVNRKAFLYIIAYDGIYMEYIDDIYKIVDSTEKVSIPKDLNDILSPGFCLVDAACELFKNGVIKNMENALKWFGADKNEMKVAMNAVMMVKNVIEFNDELYRPRQLDIIKPLETKERYTPEEYKNSDFFKLYNENIQLLLARLFQSLLENDINVYIVQGKNDLNTIKLMTNNNKRLAMISSSDDGSNIRIGVNRWAKSMHGNMMYCFTTHQVDEAVKDMNIANADLLTKYQELTDL